MKILINLLLLPKKPIGFSIGLRLKQCIVLVICEQFVYLFYLAIKIYHLFIYHYHHYIIITFLHSYLLTDVPYMCNNCDISMSSY